MSPLVIFDREGNFLDSRGEGILRDSCGDLYVSEVGVDGRLQKFVRQTVTTQAVIASEAKQSPCCKEEIASSQKTLLAMTRPEQLRQT